MIPRSILISTAAVAVIYIGINLSIIGVIPWREFVPASDHAASNFIVSVFMQRIYGNRVATIFTLLVLWTAFGSVFALLLGYSRIPYAAAQSGYFFPVFGRLHATKDFPYVSLLVLGALSIVAGFFSLGTVIDALIVTRILVQFMGQVDRADAVAPSRTAPAPPLPHVALSGAGARGTRGVDLRVRHHATGGDPVRRGSAGARVRDVYRVVVADGPMAVWRSGGADGLSKFKPPRMRHRYPRITSGAAYEFRVGQAFAGEQRLGGSSGKRPDRAWHPRCLSQRAGI